MRIGRKLFFAALSLRRRAGTAAAAEHEFRYRAPDAQSVQLMGEFNGWKGISMTRGSDGVWSAKVSLGAGAHLQVSR